MRKAIDLISALFSKAAGGVKSLWDLILSPLALFFAPDDFDLGYTLGSYHNGRLDNPHVKYSHVKFVRSHWWDKD